MPLVKNVLKSGLEASIKTNLKTAFVNQSFRDALKKHLDGGALGGSNSGAKDLSDSYEQIKSKTSAILNNKPDIPGAVIASEELVKRIVANETANAIAEGICNWMGKEWADEIAKQIAQAVSDNVDTYIKSASIIVPPGQVVGTPAGPGATSAPSPPATIS